MKRQRFRLNVSTLQKFVIGSVAKQTSILYFWFASGFALAMTIRQFLVNLTLFSITTIHKCRSYAALGGGMHYNRALTHPATKMTALRAWLVWKIFQSL
jgi:hypothetical protein